MAMLVMQMIHTARWIKEISAELVSPTRTIFRKLSNAVLVLPQRISEPALHDYTDFTSCAATEFFIRVDPVN